jgi:hypothetical protein
MDTIDLHLQRVLHPQQVAQTTAPTAAKSIREVPPPTGLPAGEPAAGVPAGSPIAPSPTPMVANPPIATVPAHRLSDNVRSLFGRLFRHS